jgi:hypothetical protein
MIKSGSGGQASFDSDLWWYWNEADGDMGRHAASLELMTGQTAQDNTPPQSRLKAAGTYRDIGVCLGELSEDDVTILRLAHAPVPKAFAPRFAKLGDLTHVVVAMAPSPEWVLVRLEAKAPVERRDELAKVVAEAKAKVEKAVGRYRKEVAKWEKMKGVLRTTERRERVRKVMG